MTKPSGVKTQLMQLLLPILSITLCLALFEGSLRVYESFHGRFGYIAQSESRNEPYRNADFYCDEFVNDMKRSPKLVISGNSNYFVTADVKS